MAFAAPSLRSHRAPLVLGDLLPGTRVRDAVLVLGGAGLTGLAAQVSIPVHGSPVPVTGQTFAVLLVGAALGWQRAFTSMALYLLAGLAGVPWYAHHGHGIDGVHGAGASFGYVLGFVLAGTVVGFLASRGGDRTPLRVLGTMLLGNVLVYAVGVPYLMSDLHVGLHGGWDYGIKNYLFGDGLKMLLAAGLLPGAWFVVRKVRGSDRG
jgi:biotin transport system substrate-specific component